MDKLLNMLGLGVKAGKAVFGAEMTMRAITKNHGVRLVILASDASENTREEFIHRCKVRQIPCLTYATKEALGKAAGKSPKAVVSIIDENIAKAIANIHGGGKA